MKKSLTPVSPYIGSPPRGDAGSSAHVKQRRTARVRGRRLPIRRVGVHGVSLNLLLPILSLTFHAYLYFNLAEHNGLIYGMYRFRTYASPIKGLPAGILISVVKLAYGWKPVRGWHPSNSEDDQGRACRVLV
ncbi:hypothetical protein AZE42_13569 [Rhizopogon vesiculosus]|uniref:Uncharacterized protein n=1 Tax=Rhizopogon vesiculosus TaxID=180088 RepID=A0A1J8QTY6_9AGAM|nr:hypothetical protein AZE42_13569 [Rhizopogon vesiculosus]